MKQLNIRPSTGLRVPCIKVASRASIPQRRLLCRSQNKDDEPVKGDRDDEVSSIPDSLPLLGADTDWRDFRARLIQQQQRASSSDSSSAVGTSEEAKGAREGYWAHQIPGPEKGCLLCASPLMFTTSQTYFNRSVILILDHNEGGSFGVILNRPTKWKLGEVQGVDMLLPEFKDVVLRSGGDVGKSTLLVVHGASGVRDATPVVKGVYMGGIDQIKQLAAEGKLDPQGVRFYLRYAGWGPGQLQGEVEAGVWYPVAAGSEAIFSESTKEGMWEEIMGLAGGELAALAAATKPSYDARIMGGIPPEPPGPPSSQPEEGGEGRGPGGKQ